MNSRYLCPTVSQFLESLHLELNHSPYTLEAYRRDLTMLCVWLHSRKKALLELTRADLDTYRHLVLPSLKASSLNRHLSSIIAYFKWATRENLVKSNPTLGIIKAKLGPRNIRSLSIAQIESLLNTPNTNTIRGVRNRAILELMYGTGLRAREALNIKVYHVDFKSRSIIVTGKGNKERLVIFGEECAKWLRLWLDMRSYVLYGIHPSEFVFFGIRDMNRVHFEPKPLARTTLYDWLQRAAHASTMTIHTPLAIHTLRHSYATHMYRRGADIRVIQLLLGHASIQSTAIYTHILTPHLHEVASTHPRNGTAWPKRNNLLDRRHK